MANTLQFVDSIASSPTLRLDLNQAPPSGKWYLKDANFSPPKLKKVRIATMLTDGSGIPASAYENRFIDLVLIATGTTKDDQATELQKFNREMDRQNNILKWQPVNATNPVFFRTFRSDYTWKLLPKSDETTLVYEIRAHIEAEPFAYGLEETNTATTNRNPATGIHFEIAAASAKGDAPTPLYLKVGGTTTLQTTLLAVRQHGTPATYYIQGEDLTPTLASDTADANASGGNVSSLNADPGGTLEWAWDPFPVAAAGSSTDYRGDYRIFARAKVSAGTFTIALDTDVTSALPAVSISSTNFRLYDLGLITWPPAPDPVYDGYTNTAVAARTGSLYFLVDRTAGAGTMSLDYVVAIPADEGICIVDWGANAATLRPIFDGPNDTCFFEHTSGGIGISALPQRVGTIPTVKPNQINRYYLLENIEDQNAITGSESLTWSYWPRWLYIRP